MGHTSASMALEVYSRMMTRDRDTGTRLDVLVRGADSRIGKRVALMGGDGLEPPCY